MTDASARPLPVEIEEIDAGWLTQALRTRAPDVTVHDFRIAELDRGTCTKIFLDLDLDEAGTRAGIPSRVLLKAGFEAHSRDLGFMHGYEVKSYAEVFPATGLPTPACYFAEFDADRQQGIVIMEDLRTRGVTLCHPLKPHTPDQVARRLTELARFHAQTWDSADFAPGGRWEWLQEVVPEGRGHLGQFVEPDFWNSCIALPRGAAASIHFHSAEWMGRALDKLQLLSSRLPFALLHGDTHLGNLYIDRDGRPGFFDSPPHKWPGIQEVSYHVGGALDPLDRRGAERDLIDHYLDELRRCGVEVPPLDETMRHYAAYLSFGYCIFIINAAVYQPEAINTAYAARFSAAMIDNDTIGALDAI